MKICINWKRLPIVLTITAAMSCAIIGAAAASESAILEQCKADLAKRFKLQTQNITVVKNEAVIWPDASLGMPEIGKAYAQVLTPGLRLILQAQHSQYLYTTSAKAFKYGGPISIWNYSMLFSKRTPNDANLNSDLYQCSLMGTNPTLLVSSITDYYPQKNGMIIITRRTSRSFHDLFYIKADKPSEEKKLYTAVDFGSAAFNDTATQWAGFVRPAMGSGVKIIVAKVGGEKDTEKTIELPEGIQNGQIAWENDSIFILVKKGERTTAYETNPKAEKPEWKEVGMHQFPGLPEMVLNKSESLVIEQVEKNVEIATVWFTGDRHDIAKITDFTMGGFDLLSPYAFIWGVKNSKPAAYAVDISTGEVIQSFAGDGENIKPFVYAPHNSPTNAK